jgi:hypothetical protein
MLGDQTIPRTQRSACGSLPSVEHFVGAYANVGGGYLAQFPLRWIRPSIHGLAFRNDVNIDVDVLTAPNLMDYPLIGNRMQAPVVLSSEWQKRFFRCENDPNRKIAYRRNVKTGTIEGPIQIDQDDVPILSFSIQCRHQVDLRPIGEFVLRRERSLMVAVDRVASHETLTEEDAIAIASLYSLYASGYPDLFGYPVNCDRYFANVLYDACRFQTHTEFNAYLHWSGFPRSMSLSVAEFRTCSQAPAKELASIIDLILGARGCRLLTDPRLGLLGGFVFPSALLNLSWELLVAEGNSFILSDRPLPVLITGDRFTAPLSSRHALLFTQPVSRTELSRRAATSEEVSNVNLELRQRAVEWLLGPVADNL